MQKQIKDYLHLYLGCKMLCLTDSEDLQEWAIKKGDIGKLVLVNSTDSNIQIQANEDTEAWNIGIEFETGYCADWFYSKDFKPILRPLWDINDNECREYQDKFKFFVEGTSNEYIEKRLYVIKQTIEEISISSPDKILWLLNKGFDLFDLIRAGLAIDSTTLNK